MAVAKLDAVRKIGLAIPGVAVGTAYGAPALKQGGKLVACLPTNRSAEPNSLLVRIGLEHRAELLREQPDTYYLTDHYAAHPCVLVRLSQIGRDELEALLRDACRFVSARPAKAGDSKGRSRRRGRDSRGG